MIAALFDNVTFTIIATGALVGIGASLLGTFLVLRGNAMLSDAISHSIVLGIVLVWMLTGETTGPVQIIGAGLTGLATVGLTEALARTRRVKDDAAIGIVFPVLFSIGVLLINLFARDVHLDAHAVLLGEIGFVWLDTVEIAGVFVPKAMLATGAMALINLAFVFAVYKELKLATFDAALASALGFAPLLVSAALLGLVSATAVAAFDAVGAVLFVAFVIVPPAAAYLLTDRLSLMLLYASLIATAASISGYWVAMAANVSIGGSMALMTGVGLVLALLFGPRHGLVAHLLRRRERIDADACRALAVHLYNHESGPERGEENVSLALREHLHWDAARAKRILVRALDQKLIVRDGAMLELTERGRAVAREILEPWSQPIVRKAVG